MTGYDLPESGTFLVVAFSLDYSILFEIKLGSSIYFAQGKNSALFIVLNSLLLVDILSKK